MIKWLYSPKIAAYIVAFFIGRPDIADDLISICHRESRCHAIGAHSIDRHISANEYYGQVSWGHLDPECQKPNAKGGWATHGPWGISSGAHWHWLPPCYQPNALDNVYVSALLAARKYVRKCWAQNKKKGWCRVKKNVRKNNIKSPRLKKHQLKPLRRPNNWYEFFLVNPW